MHNCPRCKEGKIRPEKVADLRLRRVVVTQGVCAGCASEQLEEIEASDLSWIDRLDEIEREQE